MRLPKRVLFISVTLALGQLALPLKLIGTANASDLGSTDFNLAVNLAGLAQRSVSVGSLNCSDGTRSFGSVTDMMIGLAADTRVQSQLDLNCKPTLNINSGVQTITGTISIPSKGVTDGVFTAACSARGNMSVNASVAVGAAVSGLISLNVSSASAPLAFGCSFKGSSTSKATDVFGTIEGFADVTGMCSSACVAVTLNATATVTAATGELKGQTGSGSYTYTDAFEVPELASVADRLAAMKGTQRVRDQRVSCPEGAENCTAYSSNPCSNGEDTCTAPASACPPGATCTSAPFECPAGATCTTVPQRNSSDSLTALFATNSRPPSQMRIVLRSGPGEIAIIRPMAESSGSTASLNSSQPLTVSGPPNSKCTIALVGRKTSKQAITLSADGTYSRVYSSAQIAALLKQLGLPPKSKTKPSINATLTCTGDSGAIPAKSKKLLIG